MTPYGCDEMYKKLHRRKLSMRSNSEFVSTKDEKITMQYGIINKSSTGRYAVYAISTLLIQAQ